MPRRLIGMLAAAAVSAAGLALLVAAPAQATAYRYWSYWHVTADSWSFSQVGAGGWRVSDGSVEGWRFAVSPTTLSAPEPRQPAATAFAAVCRDKPAQPGKVRVALVLDFGVAADYPAGQAPPAQPLHGYCVVVGSPATGLDVLAAQGLDVRDQAGMICGIDGYPRTGCGEVAADPTPTPTRSPTHRASPSPTRHPVSPSTAAASTAPSRPPSTSPPTARPTAAHSPSAAGSTPSATSPAAVPAAPSASAGGTSGTAGTASTPAPQDSPTLVVGAPVAAVSDAGTPWPALLVVVLVAALGAGAYWRHRRSP